MFNIDTAGMSFLDIWNGFNAYTPGPSGPGAPISLLVPQSTLSLKLSELKVGDS